MVIDEVDTFVDAGYKDFIKSYMEIFKNKE